MKHHLFTAIIVTTLCGTASFAQADAGMPFVPCRCDDDCDYYGNYCVQDDWYGGRRCDWSGPGTPCVDGGTLPDIGHPDIGVTKLDLGGPPPPPPVRLDGGFAPPPVRSDGGLAPPPSQSEEELAQRVGCSIDSRTTALPAWPWLLLLLVVALRHRRR